MVAPFYSADTVDCGGETYTLVINIQAIMAAEKAAGMGLLDILGSMDGSLRIGGMAALLWGLLRAKHSDVTLDEAAGLMFEHGTEITPKLTELVSAALPKAKAKAKDENPPKPRRGTGKPSS